MSTSLGLELGVELAEGELLAVSVGVAVGEPLGPHAASATTDTRAVTVSSRFRIIFGFFMIAPLVTHHYRSFIEIWLSVEKKLGAKPVVARRV